MDPLLGEMGSPQPAKMTRHDTVILLMPVHMLKVLNISVHVVWVDKRCINLCHICYTTSEVLHLDITDTVSLKSRAVYVGTVYVPLTSHAKSVN